MVKANFIFANITEEKNETKVSMYFDLAGDVVEIKWGNQEYIDNKLSEFGLKDVKGLEAFLQENPEQEVYEYDYKDKDGKRHSGHTLDKPFPSPSEPKKAIVQGTVKEVVDNGNKVAVIVDMGENELFTVVRGYAVYNESTKTFYPVKAKKDRLLQMYKVDDFKELVGTEITYTRQKAGENKYYDAEDE